MNPELEPSADLTRTMGGHEIWLGKARLDGDQAELTLFYGHNMRPDGSLDSKSIKPLIYKPDGSTIMPSLSSERDRHLLRFSCKEPGCYTAIVDHSPVFISQTKDGYHIGPKFQFKDVIYSNALNPMAMRIIPVGDCHLDPNATLHRILEILPCEIEVFKGGDVVLRVFYEDQPLANAEVRAVSEIEGKQMFLTKTNDQGWAKIPLAVEGDWMFLVRHKDPTKKVSEEFDETVFLTTLVMEANDEDVSARRAEA